MTYIMDALTNSIVALKQGQNASQVQFAVARKIMDQQQLQGDAAVKLIEAASKGAQAGDALVAAATGLGGTCDCTG